MYKNMPLICISNDSNYSVVQDTAPRQIYSPKAYSEAIANAGGIPMITGEFCPEELAEICDALLITGGDDVDPETYGEEILNDSVKPDSERTAFEMPLLKAFIAKGKPILGICRGCQMINVALGGTLYQDLLAQKGWIHMHREIRHDVFAQPGSVLHSLFGATFKANSTHHQAVKDLAPGLTVTARSVEGIIEAFEHQTMNIVATQFHPERLTGKSWDERTPDYAPLFKHFVDGVKKHYNK